MKKLFVVVLMLAVATAFAAPFKKVIGESFPNVKSKDLLSGEELDLVKVLAKADTKGAVLFFTSTKCPVAMAYEDRINELTEKYKSSVPFVALNANAATEDEAGQLQYAKDKGFKYHVAMDADSTVAKAIGAGCTPEFYLVDKHGKVVYHGPLDDSQDPTTIERKLLANALEALLAGKELPADDKETAAFGCGIKMKK
jgi:thiol-disulfide isomerase/thioredoxin